MARVVKVDLLLEAAKYIRGTREAEKATEDLADGLDDVARTSDKTSKSTEELGGGLDHLARNARHLDGQIKQSQQGIRDLAREIANTSDTAKRADLVKQLGLEQRGQRKLISLRKLIDFDDDPKPEVTRWTARVADAMASGLSRAGGPVASAMSNVFGTLPPQAQAAIGAGVVGAVAAAAPLIGGVVSSAIVGAAGAGGIIGGIAIAARHADVQASAKLTGETFARTMERAGVSFVPATLAALSKVRAGIVAMGGDMERAFSASSRFVSPLTDSFLAGAKRAVEGFATAVERAGPVVGAIGTIAERAGDVVGDTFESLSEHSSEAAHALLTLWGVFELGIRAVAGNIEMLTIAYGWLEKFGAILTGDTAALGRMVAEQESAKASGDNLSTGLQDLINGFKNTGNAAANAKFELQSLADAIQESTDRAIASENANIRLEQAIDDAAEAAKNGAKKGIDPNTEAGRKNRLALLGIAEAAKASAADIFKSTKSQELASVATEKGRAAFLKSAAAMGVSKKEAKELADKLFGIPSVKPTVKVTTTQTPIDLKTVAGRIAAIKSKQVVISVHNKIVTTRSEGRNVGIGDGIGGRRWGGVTEHAQWGVLREAHIASPVATARYAYAEQATGGEAFIPKRGDMARSRAIWSHVGENWLGMRPALQSASGGSTVVRNLHVTVNVPATVNRAEVGREVVEAVKAYEQSSGKGWRS